MHPSEMHGVFSQCDIRTCRSETHQKACQAVPNMERDIPVQPNGHPSVISTTQQPYEVIPPVGSCGQWQKHRRSAATGIPSPLPPPCGTWAGNWSGSPPDPASGPWGSPPHGSHKAAWRGLVPYSDSPATYRDLPP